MSQKMAKKIKTERVRRAERAMEPLLMDMACRLIRRETIRLCKWLNRLEEGNLKLHDFVEKVESFYWNEHAGDIEQALIAPLKAVAVLVSDEEKDLSQYMRDVVVRVQAQGLEHVRFFIKGATCEKELAAVLRKEVFEWHRHRAPEIAKSELLYICKEMGV